MRNQIGRFTCLLAAIVALSVCAAGIASSQTLSLDDQSAMEVGDSVSFTLSIDYPASGSGEIRVIDINIDFDHTVLTFDRHTPGALVSGWSFFTVSNPQDGQLIVGGGTAPPEGLKPGDNGAIVVLHFTVDAMDDATLTISARDGSALAVFATRSGEFTFEAPPANNPPVAMDDMGTTERDTSVTIDVLANDEDADGESLTVTATTGGSNGTLEITDAGATVTYTPSAGYTGSDTFSYTVTDGTDADTGTVTVSVTAPAPPANAPPVATDDEAETEEDQAVVISVLDNDSDADGDTLSVTMTTEPGNGMVTITGNDTTITYTPDAGYSGEDQFMYTVSDGQVSATATVYVEVDAAEVIAETGTGDSGGGGCALNPGGRFDPSLAGLLAGLLIIQLVRQYTRRRSLGQSRST